ncbi:hypothetical protein Tco_0255084 [Tanacetum coccineum]
MELHLKNNFREALETTSKDLEKKMLDLNPTFHYPQKVAVDQKKKHYKTKYALKIDEEEFKKAKSEATTKIRKLAKVYGAWLPPWLAARLVVFQLYAYSFMLCDLDFEPSSLSLSSMPSCDLKCFTNILVRCLILKASNQSLPKSLSLNLEHS